MLAIYNSWLVALSIAYDPLLVAVSLATAIAASYAAVSSLERLDAALTLPGSADTVRQLAHGLKGSAATAEATAIASAAAGLERRCAGPNVEAAHAGLSRAIDRTLALWRAQGWLPGAADPARTVTASTTQPAGRRGRIAS